MTSRIFVNIGPSNDFVPNGTTPLPEPLLINYRLDTQQHIKTLKPKQNGRHFPDDIFKCIFLNKNISIWIKISLKFVLKGSINDIPALVQIMVWRRQATSHCPNQWWLVYWRMNMRHSVLMR